MRALSEPIAFDGRGSDINDALEIQDFSDSLLLHLSKRIEKSHTLEHLVARESELDELWRLLDFAVTDAKRLRVGTEEMARLQHLRAGVMVAHDFVGVNNDRVKAAAALRALVAPSHPLTD